MYLTVSCSPGREDQNGTCRECHVGFYKNRTGAVECHACPQGFRTPTNGSTDPADCSVGELVLAVLGFGFGSSSVLVAVCSFFTVSELIFRFIFFLFFFFFFFFNVLLSLTFYGLYLSV